MLLTEPLNDLITYDGESLLTNVDDTLPSGRKGHSTIIHSHNKIVRSAEYILYIDCF